MKTQHERTIQGNSVTVVLYGMLCASSQICIVAFVLLLVGALS